MLPAGCRDEVREAEKDLFSLQKEASLLREKVFNFTILATLLLSLLALLANFGLSIWTYRLYVKKVIHAPATAMNQTQKNDQKEKLALVLGTAGICMLCSLPTTVAALASMIRLFSQSEETCNPAASAPVADEVCMAALSITRWANVALYFLLGVNSVGGMILHILFTKTYRRAFQKAIIDRIKCCKNNSDPQNNQLQQASASRQPGSRAGPSNTLRTAAPSRGVSGRNQQINVEPQPPQQQPGALEIRQDQD